MEVRLVSDESVTLDGIRANISSIARPVCGDGVVTGYETCEVESSSECVNCKSMHTIAVNIWTDDFPEELSLKLIDREYNTTYFSIDSLSTADFYFSFELVVPSDFIVIVADAYYSYSRPYSAAYYLIEDLTTGSQPLTLRCDIITHISLLYVS